MLRMSITGGLVLVDAVAQSLSLFGEANQHLLSSALLVSVAGAFVTAHYFADALFTGGASEATAEAE